MALKVLSKYFWQVAFRWRGCYLAPPTTLLLSHPGLGTRQRRSYTTYNILVVRSSSVCLRRLQPRLYHFEFADQAQAHPFGREAVRVRGVQDEVLAVGDFVASQTHPYRGEALHLPVLQQGLFAVQRPEFAPAHPHRREALRLRHMRTGETQTKPLYVLKKKRTAKYA